MKRIVVEQAVAPSRDAFEVAPGFWCVEGETAERLAPSVGVVATDAARKRVPSAPDHPATKAGRTILPTTPAGCHPIELLADGTTREVDDEGKPIAAAAPALPVEPVDIGDVR